MPDPLSTTFLAVGAVLILSALSPIIGAVALAAAMLIEFVAFYGRGQV